ncbi:CMT1A duplicated region transcript 4 protein isoform X2 [Peromyscus maniculatus bairdii]|uniref:CMT1A duplicated region transcript 4 protein isoform X2 n=1 Tax=Peromyscus maniculatus bairdii TaxID=230844 RepID=UPI001C2E4CFD|nr:CMT1A duplicated region transcript 4 protein isoform X2 [Peromyscus maniculatus bairdii]
MWNFRDISESAEAGRTPWLRALEKWNSLRSRERGAQVVGPVLSREHTHTRAGGSSFASTEPPFFSRKSDSFTALGGKEMESPAASGAPLPSRGLSASPAHSMVPEDLSSQHGASHIQNGFPLLSSSFLEPPSDRLRVEHPENTELPLTLLEKHSPWPAYVTHTSLAVRRLIDKSRVRELECMRAAEENRKSVKQSKTSFMMLKRKKSSKFSELVLKDALSGSRLSTWDHFSATNVSPIFFPEPEQLQMEAREGPTFNYNKIIFSKRPATRKLPYGLLQDSKETNAKG